MDKMTNKLTDYFPSAVWSDEQMSRWLINVAARNSQNSRRALPTSPPDKSPVLPSNCQFLQLFMVMTENGLKMDVYQLMKELCGRWEMIGARWWLFGKDTNSSEHKRQNYATSGWILTSFAAVVQRDRRTVPQVWRGKELWGQWWEHVRFPMPMSVTGELVSDEMRQLCGRSKESHRSFDDDGIKWVRRDVL
jgi:hypothetical protein